MRIISHFFEKINGVEICFYTFWANFYFGVILVAIYA